MTQDVDFYYKNKNKFPFAYTFKSMKFFKVLPVVGLFGVSVNSLFAAIECGEGKMPSAETRMCIEPNYIEGCLAYTNQNECHQCQKDYELN